VAGFFFWCIMIAFAKRRYWDYPEHRDLFSNFTLYRSANLLVWSENFHNEQMPPDMRGSNHRNDLLIEIFDSVSQQTFKAKHVVSYEEAYEEIGTSTGEEFKPYSLQGYFYREHFCGCHRAHHIEAAGQTIPEYSGIKFGDNDDRSCPRGRFHVTKIVWDKMPELILYSETLSLEEMAEQLRKANPLCP
jgi:hypothetical protein